MGRVRYRFMRRVKESLSHLRHFRGHGVHSPYVYNIVRNVFMRRELIAESNSEVYQLLRDRCGLSDRYAIELQNIYTYCGYRSFAVAPTDTMAEFVIYLTPPKESCSKDGTTIVILKPQESREYEVACERIVANHPSTTISRAKYLIIFNNHLPKQHFVL